MPQPHCNITIRGSFDVEWTDYIGDMLLDVEVADGEIQTTTLIGQPIDLTAFLGTLHMLIDLGFPVIACEYQQAAATDRESADPRALRPQSTGDIERN